MAGEIRLLHVSDLHCVADPRARVYGEVSDENLDATLERSLIDDGAPDVILATGDVADDSSAAGYARVAERLVGSAAAAHWVPGNHDKADLMGRLARDGFPRSTDLGSWDLVLLDSAWPGHAEGRLGAQQLAWLDEHLSRSQRHVAVALHHPPLATCVDRECQLSDADALLSVLGRHPHVRVVLSGHIHCPTEVRRGDTVYLGGPSTCRQIHHEPSRHAWTDQGPGGRTLTLHDDGRVEQHLTWARPVDSPVMEWWDPSE